ncbi:MAG: methyltransferase domain-containing protein [Betaproteobacteria bacterium]
MTSGHSIQFFDAQFERQAIAGDLALNSFELAALPYLRGRVLDFGCGMGNLAVAAAKRGCSVVALDGSGIAIRHLQQRARQEALDITAAQADLRNHDIDADFDTVVSIGLLMFFNCASAFNRLANLQAHVREGGVAIINVMIEGTTYRDMFDPIDHCLFKRSEMARRFDGWTILHSEFSNFAKPENRVKSFVTLIARKPLAPAADA